MVLTLFESEFLSFVEEIRLCTAQIDDLRTSIAILFGDCTFSTIIGIGTSRSSADHTSTLIGTIIAFITDANQRRRTNVRITNHTSTVAFLTQTTDGHASLFATEDQIGMMFSHFSITDTEQ